MNEMKKNSMEVKNSSNANKGRKRIKSKTKQSNTNSNPNRKDELRCGVEYKGVVTIKYRSSCVVLIDSQYSVHVFSNQFLPMANITNQPVNSIPAIGDMVGLTVRRKSKSEMCEEDWIALKCWRISGPISNISEVPQVMTDGSNMGQIIYLGHDHLRLGAQSEIIVANIEQIFLYGHQLGKVDLSLIFKIGDNLSYQVDESALTKDGIRSVNFAWFGSMLVDGETKPTQQQNIHCLDFCMKRNILNIFMELSCNPNNKTSKREMELEMIDLDEVNFDLPYINLQSINSKLPIKDNGGSKPELSKPARPKCSKAKIQSNEIVLTNKFKVLSPFSGSDQDISLPQEMTLEKRCIRDASTQTYATGEVYCFFDMIHDP